MQGVIITGQLNVIDLRSESTISKLKKTSTILNCHAQLSTHWFMCNEVHYEPGRENIKQTASLIMQLFAYVSLKQQTQLQLFSEL